MSGYPSRLKRGAVPPTTSGAALGSPATAPPAPEFATHNGWQAIPLRLIVGYGFMAHGYAKIARGPENFVDIVHAIGIPAADVMAWATIVVELVAGLAVLLGVFVAWVSLPMAVVLLVATFTVHLPNGFSSIKLQAVTSAGAQFGQPGYEADLLYLACLAALVMGGSGPFTLAGLRVRLIARRRSVAQP
jgi:putative oxidoreductase